MNEDEYQRLLWRSRLLLAEFEYFWTQRVWAFSEFIATMAQTVERDPCFASLVKEAEDKALQESVAKLAPS